jgi:predicted RNA-binding protein YlxR (DUF448 family)
MEIVNEPARDSKKEPLRKCVVCGLFKVKGELFRLALLKTDRIVCDMSGRSGGKGIYICLEGRCKEEFLKGKKCRKRFHPKMDAGELSHLEGVLEAGCSEGSSTG